jgi:prepilin-type processing-associated H-X9-DG protein
MDFDGANRANWDVEASVKTSPLYPYAKAERIWKCPSDRSTINVSGKVLPRSRTMSMNYWLGAAGGRHYSGLPAAEPLSKWNLYLKLSQVNANPGAASIFVFLDMRPDSIDAGNFGVCMDGYPSSPGAYRFWDLPGFQHSGGCSFSYADGHSEYKKWKNSDTTPPLVPPPGSVADKFTSPNNQDIGWMQERATRPRLQ